MPVPKLLQSATFRNLSVGAAALTGSRAIALGSRLVWVAVVWYFLGADLYGIVAYAQSWYLIFLPLTGLGLQFLLPQEVALAGKSRAGHLLATASTLTLAATAIGAVACAIGPLFIEDDPTVQAAMALLAVALLARALFQRIETLFVTHEMTQRVVPAIVIRPLEAPLALAAILAGGDVVALAAVHSLVWVGQASAAAYLAHRNGILPGLAPFDRDAWRMVRRALPLLLAVTVGAQVEQGPILLYYWLDGPYLGQVSLLVQICAMIALLPRAVQQVLLPAVTRRMAADRTHAEHVGAFLVSTSLIGATAAAIAFYPLGLLIATWLPEGAYTLVITNAWLALLCLGFMSACFSLQQQLIAAGTYWRALTSLLVGWAAQVSAFLVFAPQSVAGAILAGTAGFVAWSLAASAQAGLLAASARTAAVVAGAVGLKLWLAEIALPAAAGLPPLYASAAAAGIALAALAAAVWIGRLVAIPRATPGA